MARKTFHANLPLSLAAHADNLRALCDAWPEVQEELASTRAGAVEFTERAVLELGAKLYVRDEATGLYWPIGDTFTKQTFLHELASFAGVKTNDDGRWSEFRVAPEEFDKIIRLAREVSAPPRDTLEHEGGLGHYADDPRWPEELGIALTAWRAACTSAERQGKRPGAFIRDWLAEHYPALSEEARKRIATVANWDKTPGASKK